MKKKVHGERPAKPSDYQSSLSDYPTESCNRCGTAYYFDGRCGDGPVPTCNCNRASDLHWERYGNR